MADGRASEVDREILQLVAQKPAVTGPVHLGIHVLDDYDAFLTFTQSGVDAQSDEYEIRFAEVYCSGMSDAKTMTKVTSRTHNYEIMCYLGYTDDKSYFDMRDIMETFMDLLHNNARPFAVSGVIVAVYPSNSTFDLAPIFDGQYRCWVGRIAFDVEERISYS